MQKPEDIFITMILVLIFSSVLIVISSTITSCNHEQYVLEACKAYCHPNDYTHNIIDGCICDN